MKMDTLSEALESIGPKACVFGRGARESDFATRLSGFATGLSAETDQAPRLAAAVNADTDAAGVEAGPLVQLFNREGTMPQDGWIQLVPIGEFPNHTTDGDPVVQVVDADSVRAMAQSVNRDLLINYDHLAHDKTRETRAAGWFSKAEARDDGLYVLPRWTPRAKGEIEGGEYRFISPEFRFAMPKVAPGEVARVRPTQVTGAGLTNKPNLKTLKPLSNRETEPNQNRKMDTDKKLKTLLGLAEDATPEQIEAAYNRQVESAKNLSTENERLKKELETARADLVNRDMEEYADVISEDEKPEVRAALAHNRETTVKLLGKIREKAKNPPFKEVHNREKAVAPDGKTLLADANAKGDAQDKAVRDYMAQHRVDYETAFNAMRREKPDLFG